MKTCINWNNFLHSRPNSVTMVTHVPPILHVQVKVKERNDWDFPNIKHLLTSKESTQIVFTHRITWKVGVTIKYKVCHKWWYKAGKMVFSVLWIEQAHVSIQWIHYFMLSTKDSGQCIQFYLYICASSCYNSL